MNCISSLILIEIHRGTCICLGVFVCVCLHSFPGLCGWLVDLCLAECLLDTNYGLCTGWSCGLPEPVVKRQSFDWLVLVQVIWDVVRWSCTGSLSPLKFIDAIAFNFSFFLVKGNLQSTVYSRAMYLVDSDSFNERIIERRTTYIFKA